MDPSKSAEVRRILDRYLIEIVEAYDLCPWARASRTGGELAVGIVWGEPTPDAWATMAQSLLADAKVRVAMVVAPEIALAPSELREIRDVVIARVPTAGVAHFHPDAPLDLATPARLVPFVRRSPDPLLQLVPLAFLDTIRTGAAAPDRIYQAQMLGGHAAPPRIDVADRIALANHTVITAQQAAIIARLDDIAADRRASYARVGISASR